MAGFPIFSIIVAPSAWPLYSKYQNRIGIEKLSLQNR